MFPYNLFIFDLRNMKRVYSYIPRDKRQGGFVKSHSTNFQKYNHPSQTSAIAHSRSFQSNIQNINDIVVDWNYKADNDKNVLNVDIFCQRNVNLYDHGVYEKWSNYKFYASSQMLNYRYKVNCQPRNLSISLSKINKYTNELWQRSEYEKIFRFFKQIRSIQSLLLLNKPKDEHLSCKLDQEFIDAISGEVNGDLVLKFPMLKYVENDWFNVNLAMFPTFPLTPQFFTFDCCRMLLCMTQSSILTCFNLLYRKVLQECGESDQQIKEKMEQIQTEKKAFVYDKGIALSKIIYKNFISTEHEKIDEVVPFEFSVCYLESPEQFTKIRIEQSQEVSPEDNQEQSPEQSQNTFNMQCLYFKYDKFKKTKQYMSVPITFKDQLGYVVNKPQEMMTKTRTRTKTRRERTKEKTKNRLNGTVSTYTVSDEFNLMCAALTPHLEYLSWNPVFSKCDGKTSTKNDYINIFSKKLSEEAKNRVQNAKTNNIIDVVLRAIYIRVLMSNEMRFRGKPFNDIFVENLHAIIYLMGYEKLSKGTIGNKLFSNDVLSAGTMAVLPFIRGPITDESISIDLLSLDLMNQNDIFRSLTLSMLVNNGDYRTLITTVFNNIIKVWNTNTLTEFLEYLIMFGNNELKLNNPSSKFVDDNTKKYIKLVSEIFFNTGFTRVQFSKLLDASYEQRALLCAEICMSRNIDNKHKHMFEIIREQINESIAICENNKDHMSRMGQFAIADAKEALEDN